MQQSISPKILITGATGTIGNELTQQLAAKGIPFRAVLRSSDKASELIASTGAEVIVGDLSDHDRVATALEGIERAFLLTNSSEQAEGLQTGFVDMAREAGVKQIVKLSQLAADIGSPVRFLRYHAAVEQKIKDAGIPYTFLRSNLFMQALLGFRDSIASKGMLFAPIGDAKLSLIDIRDIAAVAVEALTKDGHANKTYTLTGPEALTHRDLAEQLSLAAGRPVQFVNISPEEMRQALKGIRFPEWQQEGLIEDYAHYAKGEAADITTTVQDVTGKPARQFKQFAGDHAHLFC
jgi:uncharacterized protein YbjT (DUF2867 family)